MVLGNVCFKGRLRLIVAVAFCSIDMYACMHSVAYQIPSGRTRHNAYWSAPLQKYGVSKVSAPLASLLGLGGLDGDGRVCHRGIIMVM